MQVLFEAQKLEEHSVSSSQLHESANGYVVPQSDSQVPEDPQVPVMQSVPVSQ